MCYDFTMRTCCLALLLSFVPACACAAESSCFSFKFDGRPSSELLPAWKSERSDRDLDNARRESVTTYTDPRSKLLVRIVSVSYKENHSFEWTLYLKNTNNVDTPIIEDVCPLDMTFDLPAEKPLALHHNTGSPCTPTDYAPQVTDLKPLDSKVITTSGGRPTNSDFPYFNLFRPSGDDSGKGPGGKIFVIGWPGQWRAKFSRDAKGAYRVQGGQELTHFKLHPGEEVRTPLCYFLGYRGDWIDGQNKFRRWMIDFNVPRVDGKLPSPEITPCSSHQFAEMVKTDTKAQILFIDRYLEEKIPIDYWWMDAGWYILPNGDWPNTGTWEVDAKRFPRGLREISDHAHAKGVKTIVWFEPERVTPNTELYKHADWLLGKDGEQKLLDMGNPKARQWITDHISKLITEQGVDLYRQDYNIDPLDFWRKNDAPDRQGITEIKYVEGYLAYFDELLKRHPGLRIDTCASGGRRNDLETLRRATPLLRSDYILEPLGQQQHTFGLSLWIPYYGTGINSSDAYIFQSQMCPHLTPVFDVRKKDLDYNAIRKLIAQWQSVAPLYYADFYPLTPYSASSSEWLAWQFNDPKKKEGFVQAFRRPECGQEKYSLKLRALDPSQTYKLHELTSDRSWEQSGQALAEEGIHLTLPGKPSAALIQYQSK